MHSNLIKHELPTPQPAKKSITVLGSTGSIGKTTLRLVEQHPDRFTIEALSAQDNVDLLIEQARRFKPRFAAIGNAAHYIRLREALSGTGIITGSGEEAVMEAAEQPAELVMAAIVGLAGLKPVLTAIRRGAAIALANKETLVAGGAQVLEACKTSGATLIPVDSEHNAIFQVLDENNRTSIDKITLTASGGPFLRTPREQLAQVTPEDAIKHPNWSMGAKISVDSATLMNKGLELIEAHYLFGLPEAQIDVVIHPESVVHSLVHYADGSVLAQMSLPDMATPIAHALAWPQRMAVEVPKLDLAALGALHFEAPDLARFPCLNLARAALQKGGGAPVVLNAAGEIAVGRFLAGEIAFLDIPRIVETALEGDFSHEPSSIDEVIALDKDIRNLAKTL